MARRSKVDAEQTRRALKEAATALFTQQGYSQTAISEIVAMAGTTKGAMFHYFPTKEHLFREIWTDLQVAMDEDARQAAYAARSKSDPYAAFLAGSRTYLDWAGRRDYQQIVLVDGPAILGTAGWYEADYELGHDNVRAGVQYLAQTGHIDKSRIDALSVLLQSALNGAGFALGRGAEGVDADSLFSAFEMLLRSAR